MNMMKNANNTTKTKLLTLLCKELKDSNESIAITNHYLLSSQSPPSLFPPLFFFFFFFFFFWTTLKLCWLPQVLFCTAWWEIMAGGWKLQLTSGRREEETRGKECKGLREYGKRALMLHLEKEGINEKFSQPMVRKLCCYCVASFRLKTGWRPFHLFFLLELYPSGGVLLVSL